MRKIDRTLIAGYTNGGSVRAWHHVGTKTECFDYAHTVVDLGFAGMGGHYYEHGVKRRLLTGNYTLWSNLTHVFTFWPEQNWRQRALDLCPMLLVLRWQFQIFAQMAGRFIDRKARFFSRDLEEDPSWPGKIDRVK